MQNLLKDLTELFTKDDRLVSEGKLLKNKVIELALKMDADLIKHLLKSEPIKKHFFTAIDDILVFDKIKFQKFVSNKQFLPDSYTAFKNKIGLVNEDGDYLSESKEVVLAWPYKDCVLEGGQTKEDAKRNEIFWNETLAPDEIDRLLAPKVLTNFKKYDNDGESQLTGKEEIDFSKENLVIKGNNLLALHSLYKRFVGKVKLIYIDPPYNTGNGSFQYNDSFNHSTWLSFMKNRLEISKKLLVKEGAIFVQIDYHEAGYIIPLMDQIFGRDNFIQLISVKTASPAGFKTVNPGPIDVTEYILFYTKDRSAFYFEKAYVPVSYDENYDKVIVNIEDEPTNWVLESLRDIIYKENDIEIGKSPQASAKNAQKKWGSFWQIIRQQVMAEYALNHADKIVSIRDPHKPTEKLKSLLEKSKQNRNYVYTYDKTGDPSGSGIGYVINGGALSFYSNKIKEIDGHLTPTELLTDLWTDISWDGIAREGDVKLKNGKKPEKLLRRIIDICTKENDLVLDFHAGSGTTLAVALKMKRKFIGIEQLEYGENDPMQRLSNVVNGEQSGISKAVNWKGGGSFAYCELMHHNEAYIARIRKSNTTKDLLTIWNEMQEKAFISYKVKPETINENISDFEKLTIDEQKHFLVEILDKNQLYVNYSEIDDMEYGVSETDKKLNRMFYGEA
jgi:adenine-specific DNA-methyltransferase